MNSKSRMKDLIRDVMLTGETLPVELRPSMVKRLNAYQQRFIADLPDHALDLADVTKPELLSGLVEGALTDDETKHGLIADALTGELRPWPWHERTRHRLRIWRLRIRNKIRRAMR